MTRLLTSAYAAAIVALATTAMTAHAAVIDIGEHELQPDTPNQTIEVSVTAQGGDPNVTGFNLRATIGDGTGGDAEPVFDFVDYTGGIWGDGANPSLTVPGGDPPDMVDPTATLDTSPTAQNSVVFTNQGVDVAPDGLLLTLNIDTTGITTTSSFPLIFDDTNEIGTASAFVLAGGGEDIPTITNGLIIIRTDTAQWDGEAGNDLWSTPANWSGDVAPLSGNNLIFAGDTQTTNVNDFDDFSTPSLSFAAGADPFTLTGNELTIESGGALTNNSSNLQTVDLDVTSASPMTFDAADGALDFGGTVTITSDTLTITGDNNTSLTGALAGAGDVNKTGSGTLIFDADATGFTGDLGLTSGTLQVGANAAVDADSTYTFSGGTILNQAGGQITLPGDLTVDGDFAVADGDAIDVDGDVTLSGGMRTLTIDDPDNPFVIDGIVSGDGAGDDDGIIKQGNGKLALRNANSFGGGVTLDAGIVGVGSDDALGTGTLTINTGTIEATQQDIDLDNPITVNDSFTVGDGSGNDTLTFSGQTTVTGPATMTVENVDGTTFDGDLGLGANAFTVQTDNPVELAGTITGTDTLAKTGAGTLTLSGDGSGFTGDLDIDAGTVDLSGTTGGSATVDNATLNLNGGSVTGLATLNAGANLTGAGTVGNIDSNGGTIDPGNSIGVINITGGTADFDAASIFNFEISPGDNPNTDQISYGGDATIANGATFNISLFGGASGNLADGNQFTLFLGGQGSNLNVDPAQLTLNSMVDDFDFSLALQGNDLVLTAEEFIAIVWDGSTDADGDDTNFSDADNFEEDTRAVPGGTDFEGLVVSFAADADGTATADDGGGYTNLGGIEFQDGLGAFALTGNQLTFDADASIVNNDPNPATIDNNLVAGADGLTVNAASGDLDLNGTIDLAAGGDLTFTGDNDTTADGIISGAGGINKTGSGDATLTATNTFDGGVTVSGGRLLANDTANNNAIPDDVVVTVNDPGAFWTQTDETIANIGSGSDGEIYVTGGTTLTFGGDNNDTTFDGVFEDGLGLGNVTKVGDGIATLNGDSAAAGSPLSGNFTLQGGGLRFGNDGALGNATLVIDTALVEIGAAGGSRTLSNDVTVNESFSVDGDNTLTFEGGNVDFGDLDGATRSIFVTENDTLVLNSTIDLEDGTLAQTGPGTLAIGSDNTVATIQNDASIEVEGGLLRLDNTGALGNAASLVMDGGDVEFNAAGTYPTPINAGTSFNAIATADAELTGAITGAGDMTKQGEAKLTLNADNSGYTGDITVEAGTLEAANADALGDSTLAVGDADLPTITTDGGDLELDIAGTPTVNNAITVTQTPTLTVTQAAELAGAIDGAGGLTKAGTAELTLSGTNTFAGPLNINVGAIIADATGGDGAVPDTAAVVLADDATAHLTLVNGNQTIGSLAGGGATGGIVQLNTNTLIVGDATDTTFAGRINQSGGAGALTKQGAGTLTLTGDNGYTGTTTINDGTLAVGGGDAIDDGGLVDLANAAGTFALNADETIGALQGVADSTLDLGTSALTIVGSTSTAFAGNITNENGDLIVDLDTGTDPNATLTLTGTSTASGDTDVVDGRLELDSGSAIDDSARLIVRENGTVAILTSEQIATLFDGDATGGTVELADGETLTIAGPDDTNFNGTVTDLAGIAGLVLDGDTDDVTFDFTGATFAFDGELDLIQGIFIGPATVDGDVDVEEDGVFQSDGIVTGNVMNRGRFSGNANITGNFTNEPGGTFAPGGSIGTAVIGGNYVEGGTLEIEVDGSAIDESNESDLVDVTGSATFEEGAIVNVLPNDADDDGEPDTTDGNLQDGDVFTIVTADGGITGIENIMILEDFNAFDFLLSLDGNDLLLTTELSSVLAVLNDAGIGDANQLAIAGSLDQLRDEGGPLFDDLTDTVGLDDPDALLAAVDQLSPQAFEPTRQLTVDNARMVNLGLSAYFNARRIGAPGMAVAGDLALPTGSMLAYGAEDPAMLASALQAEEGANGGDNGEGAMMGDGGQTAPADPQPEMAGAERWGAFARGLGIFQEHDTSGSRIGYDADSYGGMAGIDYQTDTDMLLGLSFGYVRSDVSLELGRGNYDIDTFRVGPYLSWNPAPWFVDLSLTYGYHNFDNTRRIPALGQTLTSDHNGHDGTAFARVGHEWKLDSGLRIIPEAAVQYTYLREESYRESGGSAALAIDDRTSQSLRSRLGVTVSYPFTHHQVAEGNVMLVPELYVGWEHEFLDEEDIDATFVGGGGSFTFNLVDSDENSILVAGGMSAVFNQRFSAFVRYEGSFSDDNEVHGLTGGLRLKF